MMTIKKKIIRAYIVLLSVLAKMSYIHLCAVYMLHV